MCTGSETPSHECSSNWPALHQTRATTLWSAKDICSLGFCFFFHFAPKWIRRKVVGCFGVNSQWPMCKVLLLHLNIRAQQWYRCVHLPLSLKRWTWLFLCTRPLSCRGGTLLVLISLPARTFVTHRKSRPLETGSRRAPCSLHSHLLCQ